MKHQKILTLLHEANDSKLKNGKWNIGNDNSRANSNTVNEIAYNT